MALHGTLWRGTVHSLSGEVRRTGDPMSSPMQFSTAAAAVSVANRRTQQSGDHKSGVISGTLERYRLLFPVPAHRSIVRAKFHHARVRGLAPA
jgi:hypothetical protein